MDGTRGRQTRIRTDRSVGRTTAPSLYLRLLCAFVVVSASRLVSQPSDSCPGVSRVHLAAPFLWFEVRFF